jgi:hypothetical protein
MKRASVSIRFDDHIDSELEIIAEASGIKKAAIIRQATVEYLQKIKADGKISIPVIFEDRPNYGTEKNRKGGTK